MKARRLVTTRSMFNEMQAAELPPLGERGVLVKHEVTAVSPGTEHAFWMNGKPSPNGPFPFIAGCSCAGIVQQVGPQVTDVKPGDRVAAQGNHCDFQIYEQLYFKIPPQIPADDAAFHMLMSVSLRGIRKSRIELGSAVAVLGLGVIGQFALSLAKLAGAMPLIAIDIDDRRLALARQRGADAAINSKQTADLPAAVAALCPERGVNVLIEASGNPVVYPTALSLICTGGQMVALGSPRAPVEINFYKGIHQREIEMVGAYVGVTPTQDHPYYRHTKARDRKLLLDLIAQGRLSARDLITHRWRPDNSQAMYEMLHHEPGASLGVVFDWTAS